MRMALTCAAGVTLALLSRNAAADCMDPGPAPAIAKGATASDADMVASHHAVQNFVKSLEDYQACLETQIRNSSPDADVVMRQAWRAQGNAAVDLAHDLAGDYTTQYQIFKSKH